MARVHPSRRCRDRAVAAICTSALPTSSSSSTTRTGHGSRPRLHAPVPWDGRNESLSGGVVDMLGRGIRRGRPGKRPLRAGRRRRSQAAGTRPFRPHHRRNGRGRRPRRPRVPDRTCSADLEGAAPARPARGVHALDAGGRASLRPVDPPSRPPRSRDPRSRRALAGHQRLGRRVGVVDRNVLPARTATTSCPARSCPCGSKTASAATSSRTSGCGTSRASGSARCETARALAARRRRG